MATSLDARLEQYDKLHDLIWERDLAEVVRYTEDEDITGEEYYSILESLRLAVKHRGPLATAAALYKPDILKYLISLGFDPNAAPPGETEMPIHSACKNCTFAYNEDDEDDNDEERGRKLWPNDLEMVKILVEDYKVDVNVENFGFTPLRYAAEGGRVDIMKVLVEAGADINAHDKYMWNTCLHWAARSGSAKLCKHFLSLGAKVDVTNRDGQTPLHYATAIGTVKVAEVLLAAGAGVNKVDNTGCSPVYIACVYRRLHMMRYLCSHGANLEQSDNTSHMLSYTIENNGYDILRYLVIEKRVSLNGKDINDKAPFYVAMTTGNMKAAKLLVNCGCKIDKEACVLESVPESITFEEEKKWRNFVKELQEMSEKPRKLSELCCFKIRSHLRGDIVESVNVLRIPEILKDAVALKHV